MNQVDVHNTFSLCVCVVTRDVLIGFATDTKQVRPKLRYSLCSYAVVHGRGVDVLVESDIAVTSSGTDVNLILALTTATYNNLQRHRWWYVWSPTHAHAPPRPRGGSRNLPSVWGSGCAESSKDPISLQVFHQSAGWCNFWTQTLALLNA